MHPQPGSRIHVPKPNLDRSLAGYVAGIPGKLPASQPFIALSFKACLNCGKGLSVGLFFFCDRWWLAHHSMAEVTMVFSVRGRRRYWGISQLEGTVLLVVVSNVPVPSSFRNASVVCNVSITSKKGTFGDTKWSHVKSTKCSRMQQLDLEVRIYLYIYNYLLEVLVLQWVLRRDGSDVFFLLCGQHHRRNIWHFICAWLPSLWIIPAQRKSTSDPAITLESFSTARRWKPLQTITVAKWNPRYRQIW